MKPFPRVLTDAHESIQAAAGQGIQHTAVEAVTDPSMVPMANDAGGETVDKDPSDEPSEEQAAAQLGDFA